METTIGPTPKAAERARLNGEVRASKLKRDRGKFVSEVITADHQRHSTFEWVPTDKLLIDRSYQRTTDKSRVSVIAHSWNPDLSGVFVVSQRDNGAFYVIDGQHRHAAIQLMSNPPEMVFAEVHRGLTVAQEARLFYELDTKRAGLTTGAEFTALVTAKDPIALGIVRAADEVGMTVDYAKGSAPGNLRAFRTLMEMYKRISHTDFVRVLRVVNNAWPTDPHSGAARVLEGIEVFFQKYPEANEKRLTRALSMSNPALIENNARVLKGTLSSAIRVAVAMVIHGLYNKGLKQGNTRLDAWAER